MMSIEESQQSKNYFKRLMKKAKNAVKLVIGNSEVYSTEDSGGDLRFEPSIMMKINVTFDKEFLPKEKVVKINVRGNRFFYEHKRDLRVINSIYVVYPSEYVIQFDVRREEWEKHLMDELNSEYKLDLKRIHFINEEEICRMYQRKGIKEIRSPYNLQKGELLIIVGGFINFNMDGTPLCDAKVNLKKESGVKDGKVVKKTYESHYFGKYDQRAGAYFFVGGEWYHNIFIPEMYNKESSRFFSFRIAGDGKSLMFFSDLKMRGIDIRDEVKTASSEEAEEIIYTINPAYFGETGIVDFKLSTIYEIKEEIEIEEEKVEKERAPVRETPVQAAVEVEEKEPERKIEIPAVTEESESDEVTLPCLETEMILLPIPRDDDISSYIMSVGEEKKSIKFYTSSTDNEVSILAPEREKNVYKRTIGDAVNYSIKLDSVSYSISNTLLSRLEDKELKLYFAWALHSNTTERIYLKSDFYIFGREPLDNLNKEVGDDVSEQLVRLNKGDEDFWRIGASRDHALLLKEGNDYTIYNISFSFPIYLVNPGDMDDPLIRPSRIEPVSSTEKEEKLVSLLAQIKEELASNLPKRKDIDDLAGDLSECASSRVLEHNDLVIIGNKAFRYIIPVVMEAPLSHRAQKSILRKIELNKSIVRK
jgi:hypothetical protein